MNSDLSSNESDDKELNEGYNEQSDENNEEDQKPGNDSDADSEDMLDDEDIDLINENLNMKFARKRKKAVLIDSDDEDNQIIRRPPQSSYEDRQKSIKRKLFNVDSDEDDNESVPVPAKRVVPARDVPKEQISRKKQPDIVPSEDEEGFSSEASSVDSFIVDEDGRPLSMGHKKRKVVHSDARLQAAQDVFGVDMETLQEHASDEDLNESDVEPGFDEEDFDEDDSDFSDEVSEHGSSKRRSSHHPSSVGSRRTSRHSLSKKNRRRRGMYDLAEMNEYFEPNEIERNFYTREDQVIREHDMPERFQTRCGLPVHVINESSKGYESEINELNDEAKWIYHQIFFRNLGFISAQDYFRGSDNYSLDLNYDTAPTNRCSHFKFNKSSDCIPKIKSVLVFIHAHLFEVPFIAFYRKEHIDQCFDINDLWLIYQWDEHWWTLRNRKNKMCEIFTSMLNWQRECIQHQDEFPDTKPFIKSVKSEPIASTTPYNNNQSINSNITLQVDMDNVQQVLNISPVDHTLLEELENCTSMVRHADTIEEIRDVQQHFRLLFADHLPGLYLWMHYQKVKRIENANDPSTSAKASIHDLRDWVDANMTEAQKIIKQVQKLNSNLFSGVGNNGLLYNRGKRAGLKNLVEQFGLSAIKFGQNLRDLYQQHEVSQIAIMPRVAAADFLSSGFLVSESVVLQVARYMFAFEIAHDPNVIRTVRRAFEERATICVTPTRKGRDEIDECHSLFPIKYLIDKPLSDLSGDEFLRIDKCRREKLLNYNIEMDIKSKTDSQNSTYQKEILEFLIKDEYSEVAKAWNAERNLVLQLALEKFLYPKFRKEIRFKLLRECYEGIRRICQNKLYHWLKVGSYPNEDRERDPDLYGSRSQHNSNNNNFLNQNLKGVCARVISLAFEENYNSTNIISSIGSQAGAAANFSPVVIATFLDGWGQPVENLKFLSILRSENTIRKDIQTLRNSDVKRLTDFIKKHLPNVICVGADSRNAIYLQETVTKIVTNLENDRIINHMIPIILIDCEASLIFSMSKTADIQMHNMPRTNRMAISLGRRLQDPLLELSQLFNFNRDILNLRMHEFQHELPADFLLFGLEMEFVNRVNEVGVDVNRCLEYPHTRNVIQFVAGLGPRKGFAMLKNIERSSRYLVSRMGLVKNAQLTPHVIINCAGFIRIDPSTIPLDINSTVSCTLLDRTRIHPESYRLAGKMATDALDTDEQADLNSQNEPSQQRETSDQAIEEIMQSPERLRELDLDAFADELKRQGHGDKLITLYDIRMELTHPYKDLRVPFRPPSTEEIFQMVIKETPSSFHVGSLVTPQILRVVQRPPKQEQLENANPVRSEITGLWICPFCHQDDFLELSNMWSHFDADECRGEPVGLHCILENGVTGFLPTRLLSDSKVSNIFERIQLNMSIVARVNKIYIDKFRVELTSRTSDLRDDGNKWRPQRDNFYDYDAERRDINEAKSKLRRQSGPRYAIRTIFHPNYHNITYNQFLKMAKTLEIGDIVIRPSSKGDDHLTVSWKLDENVIHHIDVLELEKPNSFTLGRVLRIGDEDFEDLDEIIARFVQPMVSYVREIMAFHHFRDTNGGQKEMMQGILHREKTQNRSRIPYFITSSSDFPGKFILFYLPSDRTQTEYVSVTPNGLRFRERLFDSISRLVDWFKLNYNRQ